MSDVPSPTPGDSRRARLGRELALHALGWAVTFALLCLVLDLRHVDFRYPMALFAGGDGVYYAAQVKIMLETGWVYHHPDLGAPFGLYLYDFAHFDALHLFVMKLIGYIVPDWAVVLNVYYLLTFLLSTTTALALFRHLRFRAPLALALALLFSFQPYHFDRGQGHIMLAGYYHLPLMAFALVWLLQPLGLSDSPGASVWRSRRFFVAGLFAFLGVFAGHYYTAFACMGYLTAATYSALRLRRWAPLGQAGLLFCVIGVGFTLNMAPNVAYWWRQGANREVSAKHPVYVEIFSLRLTQMLLPVPDHRFRPMRELTERYQSVSPLKAGDQSAVGLVVAFGVVALIAFGLFAPRRDGDLLPGLGVVTLAVLLFTTLAGFGTLFAHLVTPQFHGLGRVAVYLAMLGLIAVGLLTTRLTQGTRRPWAWAVAVLACGAAGLLDQLPRKQMFDPPAINRQFLAGRQFAEAIQEAVPPGTAVYHLPSSTFPFGSYEALIPFLYTKGLRWTEPMMRNRRGAVWQEAIEALPAEAFLEQLALLNIDGLILDARADKVPLVAAVRHTLSTAGAAQPIHSGEGKIFYDLRGHAARLRGRYTREDWASRSFQASQLVYARWLPMFLALQRGREYPEWVAWRWCKTRQGKLELINDHDGPVRATLTMRLYAGAPAAAGFTVASPLLPGGSSRVEDSVAAAVEVVLPPGRHPFTITHLGDQPLETPYGPRWFRVDDFHISLARPDSPSSRH